MTHPSLFSWGKRKVVELFTTQQPFFIEHGVYLAVMLRAFSMGGGVINFFGMVKIEMVPNKHIVAKKYIPAVVLPVILFSQPTT